VIFIMKLFGVIFGSMFGMMILVSTYGEIVVNKNGLEEVLIIFVTWCIIWAMLQIKNSLKRRIK